MVTQKPRLTITHELWDKILSALPDSPFVGEPDNLRQRIDALRVVIENGEKVTLQFMWKGNPISQVMYFEEMKRCTFTIDIAHVDATMKVGLINA